MLKQFSKDVFPLVMEFSTNKEEARPLVDENNQLKSC